MYGKNSFTDATVMGGTTKNRVTLAKKATLTVGDNTTMEKLHLNADNATLKVTGVANTLGSLRISKNTNINYDVSKVESDVTTSMLAIMSKNTQKLGKFSVNVSKNQGLGTYELSNNIAQSKNTSYTINLGSTKLGIAKLNGTLPGTALTKNGVTYSLKSSGNQINLKLTIKAGEMLKAKTGRGSLVGTTKSDVFYGSESNDVITGKNGHDVAVYDEVAWGKDIINKTGGTMTLLFKDVSSWNIMQQKSGSDMVITKGSDSNQKIIVKGWNDDTHKIVFGNGMSAFYEYVNAASPTKAQISAARNEVFHEAGLASA